MLIKILLGFALIGAIGFIIKARKVSKLEYHDKREYVWMYIFFICYFVSLIGVFYFA